MKKLMCRISAFCLAIIVELHYMVLITLLHRRKLIRLIVDAVTCTMM